MLAKKYQRITIRQQRTWVMASRFDEEDILNRVSGFGARNTSEALYKSRQKIVGVLFQVSLS